ncbi:CLA4A-like protein [Mya arenaria]|uniref:CLA4A-like protein n=1 Tax=Mya arenaria TaxID=6604 RepID=A0ABY7FZ91_MYAAR|nr:CLA4A-like protein [Mya arenaria]
MILVIFLTVCSFTSAIVLKDNGYEDVNIVIQDSVEPNWTLIERIKKVFTDASRRLFEATENRHDGKWEPTRCTAKVEGRVGFGFRCGDSQSLKYCDVNNASRSMFGKCRFCPSISQSANTSIMSFQLVQSESRIEHLHDAGVYVLQEVLRNGSWLGIVWFSRSATQKNEIVQITDDSVLSISQAADPRMINIASDTGGKHFTYLDRGRISFAAVFSEAVSGLVTETDNQALTKVYEFHRTDSISLSKLKLAWEKPGEYIVTVISSNHHTWDYIVKSLPSEPHPILVTSRLSTTKFDFSLQSADLPVLYVDVTKGKAPVVGAIIEAHVEASSNLCTLSPKDNGQDPDSLEGDGTYSVYLLPKCLTNGRLNVRVLVNGQANGTSVIKSINGASAIDESEVEPEIISDSFQRFSLPEPIYIKNFSTNKSDTVAPGQITDVNIVNIETQMTSNGESRNFTVSWTATGNDMNIGQVDAEQTYVDTAYLGIAAVDEAGNQGKVSNIVSIVVAKGFRMNFEGKTNSTKFEDEIITSPATTVATETVTATAVATDAVTTETVTATTVATDAVTQKALTDASRLLAEATENRNLHSS